MDILDIFDEAPKKPELSPAELASAIAETHSTMKRDNPPPPGISKEVAGELPDHLVAIALAAAVAHDDAASADALYREAETRLRKQMESELVDLKAKRAVALEKLSESLSGLLSDMDKADISKIPMIDRPDIVVKVSPGKRKSITKKWLIESYGNEEAKKIWDSVPTGDSKRQVIVPDRYEDEPDSY